MKNLTRNSFLLIALGLSLFSSCDTALDVEADNSLSGNALTNDANIQSALLGAYVNFMGIFDGGDGGELLGGDLQLMATLLTRANNTEISWDEIEAPDYEDFIDKDILDINGRIEANWRRAYETINTVNGILENLQNVSNASDRTRIEGEARAIRGILYFELVRFYAPQYISTSAASTGGVPLLLASISDVKEIETPTKASVAAVYTQAIQDLTSASTLLDGVSTDGRISNYACEAYLARIALQQNDFVTAETHLNNVIAGPFTLATTSMGAFNNATPSSEDILYVQQNASSNTGTISSRTGLVAHVASITNVGFSAMRILPESLNSTFLNNNPEFDAGDARAETFTGIESNSGVSNVPATAAYYNDPVNTLTISSAKYLSATNVLPVIRLSEMYLSRAEALIEQNFVDNVTGQALADLNAIR
ncbi:MAG: RagB/SusD family nutrient uptake outer membrane protein, partial [Bacteroidota bacterium]